VKTIRDTRQVPTVELRLTAEQVAALEAAEETITADLRFEHLVPAGDLILEFAADCVSDRQADQVKAFMDRHAQEAVERVCYFGVESLGVEQAMEVAGVRLLPADDPEVPDTNPLFKTDKLIKSFAAALVTGTNDVLMAARAREFAAYALRVLRIALRQNSLGLNPEQLRFRLGTSYAFADSGGGWAQHDDVAYPLVLPADMTPVLASPVAGLPPAAAKKSINEKAMLAVSWLDRAVFTSDPLVATLFRFFALEALLGDASEGLKNGLLACGRCRSAGSPPATSATPTTRSSSTTRCAHTRSTARSRRR
jgi:hypothetical protein